MFKQDNLLRYDNRKISNLISKDNIIKIIPVIEAPSNMYENENAPNSLSFKLDSELEGKLLVDVSLTYPCGGKEFLESFVAQSGDTLSVALPDVSSVYGVFILDVTVSSDSGKVLCEQPIPFSHLRVGSGSFKKNGSCVHLIYHDIPDTYQCFEHLERCGIKMIRDDLLWMFMETEKGKPEVKENYRHTVDCLIDKGFEIHGLLLYGNQFYDDNKAPVSEEGLAAYINYCTAMVSHYKGKINHYEIWNEYNLGFGGVSGTPEAYAKMLKAAYTAIKAVDPQITVTAAVTCNIQPEWIRRMLAADTYDYFDEISIHPYCGWPDYAYPDENQGQAERNVQCYKDVIAEFGEVKPVWISEMGWTTGALVGGIDREAQAASIARLFVITETSDIIERTAFYDFRDDGVDNFNMEFHWGLVEAMHSVVPNAAKESYAAISCLNFMIGNAEYIEKSVTESIKHTLYREGDKYINILWSLDGKKDVTLSVCGDAVLYDMYGNESKLEINVVIAIVDINVNLTYIVGSKVEVLSSQKPIRLAYEYPYTLSAVPELREDGWYLKAVVHSHTRRLEGRLRIEMPELDIAGNYSLFAIGDGESFETEIKVGEADYKKLYRALVDINLTNGERKVQNELVSFLNIPYGDEKTVINLSSKERYFRIGGEECPELNAEIKMSYDEERLYITADVFDKSHLQLGTTGDTWMDIWDGDSIELIIQPLYDGNRDITRYSQIGLALTSNRGEKIVWRWRTVSNRSNCRIYDWDFEARREQDKTVYDVALKWKDLLPPNVELSDCDSFGFVLRVNYADSNPKSIDGYTQLYSGLGSWRKPHSYQPYEFGRFVLGKK